MEGGDASVLLEFKEDGITRLPEFAKRQPLGTTLKNFVMSSNHPLLVLKFFFKLFFLARETKCYNMV